MFAPGVPVGFMVDRVALGHDFLRFRLLSRVNIIPAMLSIQSCAIWRWAVGSLAAAVLQGIFLHHKKIILPMVHIHSHTI